MLRSTALAAILTFSGSFVFAQEDVSAETIEKIDAVLAELGCEMDHDDIEIEDGEIELDDVLCPDGQYDIDLDENFEVTNRRKE